MKEESPRFLEGYVCISSRGPPLPLDLELYSRAAQVVNCQCLNGDTRDKLLNIIEVGCGTPQDLDAVVRDLELFREEDSLLGDGAFH